MVHISRDSVLITMLELDMFWVSIYQELGDHSLAARCELVLSAKVLVGVRRCPHVVRPRIVHPTVCLYSTYQTGQGLNGILYNGPLLLLPHLFSSFSPTSMSSFSYPPTHTDKRFFLENKRKLANTQMAPLRDQRADLQQLRKGK